MPRMDKRWMLLMHILFLFYSAGSVCSKIASGEPFMRLAAGDQAYPAQYRLCE